MSLKPLGGFQSQTDTDGAQARYGPATIFGGKQCETCVEPPSGPITVTTWGVLGPSGFVKSSADITLRNGGVDPTNPGGIGPSTVVADRSFSQCSATPGGAITASTTIENGLLQADTGDDSGSTPDHPPVFEVIPTNPAPNTPFSGHLHINGARDNFHGFYNEQVVDATDGSLTVNAVHLILDGPTAVGDLWISQSMFGTVPTTLASYSAPTVTSIAPTSGPSNGGTSVLITGSGFTGAHKVQFGTGNKANFDVDSDTQITATSPAHAAWTVSVSVSTLLTPGSNTSAASPSTRFTYIGTPTVTRVNPGAGTTAGGDTVTIQGTNFTSATDVKFGTTSGTIVSINPNGTILTATTPSHAAGTVDVTVTGPNGTSATTAADKYTYLSAPVVTGISPSTGPAGTSVVITGSGFTSASSVLFGSGNPASYTVNSDTQITATAPAHVPGAVSVYVKNAAGTSAPGSATYTYTY